MPWQATCAVVKPVHGYAQRSTQPSKRCSKSKMGHLKTFTSRAFIVRTVAIAGGVAFGGWKALKSPFEANRGRCIEPLAHYEPK